jgi:hypothetical protein
MMRPARAACPRAGPRRRQWRRVSGTKCLCRLTPTAPPWPGAAGAVAADGGAAPPLGARVGRRHRRRRSAAGRGARAAARRAARAAARPRAGGGGAVGAGEPRPGARQPGHRVHPRAHGLVGAAPLSQFCAAARLFERPLMPPGLATSACALPPLEFESASKPPLALANSNPHPPSSLPKGWASQTSSPPSAGASGCRCCRARRSAGRSRGAFAWAPSHPTAAAANWRECSLPVSRPACGEFAPIHPLPVCSVPSTCLWSEALLPKPRDWGPHIQARPRAPLVFVVEGRPTGST